jgi:hypothetical protein
MAQLTIEVPDIFVDMPQQEQELLIRAGLYQATQGLVEWLKKEVTEGYQQIKRFEERYGVTFARFEAELLPTLDSFEAHDDYNDWFFWQNVLNERQRLLIQLQRFELN